MTLAFYRFYQRYDGSLINGSREYLNFALIVLYDDRGAHGDELMLAGAAQAVHGCQVRNEGARTKDAQFRPV